MNEFEVRSKEIETLLRRLGNEIKEVCPPGWGFSLLIFEFQGSSMFYLSRADRGDVVKAMKEFIAKQEVQ